MAMAANVAIGNGTFAAAINPAHVPQTAKSDQSKCDFAARRSQRRHRTQRINRGAADVSRDRSGADRKNLA